MPLLLTNPFIDGSFWQRKRYADSMRPYWWGFAMVLSYLCVIAVLGLLGPTHLALVCLFAVVFFACIPTVDSSLSAILFGAGRKVSILVGIAAVGLWYTVSSIGLLTLWAAMFSWYPLMFAWQVLTYHLEKRQFMKLPLAKSLAARDPEGLTLGSHLSPLPL